MQLAKLNWIRYNFYVVLISGYFAILLLGYVYFGVLLQSTLGIVSLALLPITVLLGRTKEFLRDWSPFLTLLLSYEALQGIAGSVAASRGVLSIYPIDSALWGGTNVTGEVQRALLSPVLTDVATLLYSLHLPLVAVLATSLWYLNKLEFKRYVLALVICSYFSLMVFLALPTSPPWYTGVASNLITPSGNQSAVGSLFLARGTD